MSVLVDGIVFSLQRQGGISVYFRELLDHLVWRRIPASMCLETPLRQELRLSDASLSVARRRARPLERYRRCRTAADVSVFHSSYYRRPDRRLVPTVVTVHDFIYERYTRGPRRWVHLAQKHAAIRAAQAVICISESTRQDLLRWVGETVGQSVYVIHNGVSAAYRPVSVEAAPNPYVLYVGERGGYKNFRLLLDAMASLPELELHCVGGGPIDPRELAAVDAGVRRRVRHCGFLDEPALNRKYNAALCLAYPSAYEGFGIPVLEAMRADCPVVCINCKAVLEVGRNALTVAAAADGRALADAIERTIDGDYRRMVVGAGAGIAATYSWAATHEQTLQVYQSLGGPAL